MIIDQFFDRRHHSYAKWSSDVKLMKHNLTGYGSSTHQLNPVDTFSRMRSEGSRFIWGSGGGAVFAESCVYVRNRPQPSATVCVSAVRLSTVASAPGVIPKACQVDSLSSQLHWRLQRRCLCEWSVLSQLYWCLQSRCLWEWSVAPQLYWRLQRSCLCERAVSPQLCVWVICVAAVIFAFAEAVSVWLICVAAVILVFAEEVSVWVICIVAVILALAEAVSVWVICVK